MDYESLAARKKRVKTLLTHNLGFHGLLVMVVCGTSTPCLAKREVREILEGTEENKYSLVSDFPALCKQINPFLLIWPRQVLDRLRPPWSKPCQTYPL